MIVLKRLSADKSSGKGAQAALRYLRRLKSHAVDEECEERDARRGAERVDEYLRVKTQKWIVAGDPSESLVTDRGSIDEADFLALASGIHPGTGEALSNQSGKRSPGHDITFAVPKNISVIWAASDVTTRAQIEAELHEASRATLDYGVRQGWFQTRRGSGRMKTQRHEAVRQITGASFIHSTNREGDPSLHQHTVVMGVAGTHDRQWRALDFNALFENQKVMSARFDAELSHRLRGKFGLLFQANGHNAIDVAGVPAALTKLMSKRADQIDSLAHDHATQAARDILWAATRQDKDRVDSPEQLEIRWKQEIAAHVPIDAIYAGAIVDGRPIDRERLVQSIQARSLRQAAQRAREERAERDHREGQRDIGAAHALTPDRGADELIVTDTSAPPASASGTPSAPTETDADLPRTRLRRISAAISIVRVRLALRNSAVLARLRAALAQEEIGGGAAAAVAPLVDNVEDHPALLPDDQVVAEAEIQPINADSGPMADDSELAHQVANTARKAEPARDEQAEVPTAEPEMDEHTASRKTANPADMQKADADEHNPVPVTAITQLDGWEDRADGAIPERQRQGSQDDAANPAIISKESDQDQTDNTADEVHGSDRTASHRDDQDRARLELSVNDHQIANRLDQRPDADRPYTEISDAVEEMRADRIAKEGRRQEGEATESEAPVVHPDQPAYQPDTQPTEAPADDRVTEDARALSDWLRHQAVTERTERSERADRPQTDEDLTVRDEEIARKELGEDAIKLVGRDSDEAQLIIAEALVAGMRHSSAIDERELMQQFYLLAAQRGVDPVAIEQAYPAFLSRQEIIHGQVDAQGTSVKEGRRAVTTEGAAEEEETIRRVAANGVGQVTDLSAGVDHQPGAEHLSAEQRIAARKALSGDQISAVEGRAGVGKTTAAKAIIGSAEEAGYTPIVLAPEHQMAATLTQETGKQAGTIQGYLHNKAAIDATGTNSIILVDEAGKASRQDMAKLMAIAERTGARVVLQGDREQMQSPGGGSPLQIVADEVDFAKISTIRRQQQPWMAEATGKFAERRADEGMADYAKAGKVDFADSRDTAIDQAADKYVDFRAQGSALALARTRNEVTSLNEAIRERLVEKGDLGEVLGVERARQKMSGNKDRIVDLQIRKGDRLRLNEKIDGEGVITGDLATVVGRDKDGKYQFALDREGGSTARPITVDWKDLAKDNWHSGKRRGRTGGQDRKDKRDQIAAPRAVHAFAQTIHASQGQTVDRTVVLDSSSGLDGREAYVASSRHRKDLAVIVDKSRVETGIRTQDQRGDSEADPKRPITAEETQQEWLNGLKRFSRNINASDIVRSAAQRQEKENTHDRTDQRAESPADAQRNGDQLDRTRRSDISDAEQLAAARGGRPVRDAASISNTRTPADQPGSDQQQPDRDQRRGAAPRNGRGERDRDRRPADVLDAGPSGRDRRADGGIDGPATPGGQRRAGGSDPGDPGANQEHQRQTPGTGGADQPDPRVSRDAGPSSSVTPTTLPEGPRKKDLDRQLQQQVLKPGATPGAATAKRPAQKRSRGWSR